MARHLQYVPLLKPDRPLNQTGLPGKDVISYSNNRHQMNKTRVCGVRNVGLSIFALTLLVIAVANIPAEYSLPALLGSSTDAEHNANIDKDSQPVNESFKTGWRYTKNGWQNLQDWEKPASVTKPALHPVVVSSLQLLVSLVALIASSTRK